VPRGGARAGRPGAKYPNRSDLPGKVLPIQTAPSTQYGQAAASVRSQQAVPMAAPPAPAQPSAAPPPIPPGGVTPLNAPSERPGEHVMTGAPVGPGAGPEVLGPLAPAEADPELGKMRTYLPVLELAASQPDSSPALRQLVRQIRGNLPSI
jgi:hypothetical protein